jgi:HlyD family secretion protein
MQSEAKLKAIDARLSERTLTAPFGGVITDIGLTVGEVSEGKSIALVASDIFELTVRVPEIDITRLALGQTADVRFDAQPNEITRARVGFISPTATLIDGVAYFEAKLRFDTPPTWFRSGLNADVDIVISEARDTLKIPKRFLVTEGDTRFVLIPDGTVSKRIPVEVSFVGNDGFVAITGSIGEGDTVIAP